MKTDPIIDFFHLRDATLREGETGQKMDEECIRKFVFGDPSKHCKYLRWMLYQAGGGGKRLKTSINIWQNGEKDEPSLREVVKRAWIKFQMDGYTDQSTGEIHAPATKEEAEKSWAAEEPQLRADFVFGDLDHYRQGGFGFCKTADESEGRYDAIIDAVQKFHKYSDTLRAWKVPMDLTIANYPEVKDLQVALSHALMAHTRKELDHDILVDNDLLRVVCPYTVGSSLKYGIDKWCTANETEIARNIFQTQTPGIQESAWQTTLKYSILYYCMFKCTVPVHLAIQVSHSEAKNASDNVLYSRFWDSGDNSHTLENTLRTLENNAFISLDHLREFKKALRLVSEHAVNFDKSRVITVWSI